MTKFLKKPKFSQWHGMAEMYVDARRIDAIFDPQRLARLDAAFKLLPQFRFRLDLLDAATDQGELFLSRFHDSALDPEPIAPETSFVVHAKKDRHQKPNDIHVDYKRRVGRVFEAHRAPAMGLEDLTHLRLRS